MKRYSLKKIFPRCFSSYVNNCPNDHISTTTTALLQREAYESWASLKLLLDSCTKPNVYAFVHLLRASTNLGWDFLCQQLHSYILRSGFCSDVSISTALIHFYGGINSPNDAHKLLVDMPQPCVVSWNSTISGFLRRGQSRKALDLYFQLERSEIPADSYSLTAALVACGRLGVLRLGRSIHSKVVKLGIGSNTVISNCLIDMYGKCGSIEEAILVFDQIVGGKDIISWNSVIAACAQNGCLKQAIWFFGQMPRPDTISYNELISGFAQCGEMEEAIKILSNMPTPNLSSWNTIITGYVNRNQARRAVDIFCKMHSEDIIMDQFTFSSILSGVAGLPALTWGMLIHCCTIKCGLDRSTVVGSALINMYSKCGEIRKAESIFQALKERNLVTWNAMISGFAHSGKFARVIDLFEQLQMEANIKPDEITFHNVLSAFSHNQTSLEAAYQFFELMVKDYGIEPTVEHCCCMIRLMGHRGELRRAEWLIYELGFGASAFVWRALLGACEGCRDLKVAKIAAAKVIELEGDKGYAYVVISNICASYGKWEDVEAFRELIREKGMRKEAACSWIEVQNVVPNFALCY